MFTKALTFVVYRINYALFNRYFKVAGHKYRYYINTYLAVYGERVIEIPFATAFKDRYVGKKTLEVGNVLSYHQDFKHTIVDKYEMGDDIINVDIVEFSTSERYDAVISISTIEHVGFDEPIIEKNKALKALIKIIELLQQGGEALITVPLGYNPEIDDIVINHRIVFQEEYFLKRVSKLNLWEEASMDDAILCKYGSKFPFANAVAFLIYKKV